MQPDRGQSNDWQQPNEQPSQAPYEAPVDIPPQKSPVVTLTPDDVLSSADMVSPEEEQVPLPEDVPPQDEQPVHWQANEYIHHEKDAVWFIVFTLVVLGLIAFSIFVIQSITFTILIPVMAAALIVYSRRPPRLIDYTLSSKGLHVNDRLYPFTEFKGFGVIRDGKEYSIMLIPIKRFKPGVSVYFPEEAGEAIVDILGTRLPMQKLHLDIVDKIIRKLRI
jgi:hypothetical protein